MGRHKTTIPFNSNKLREILKGVETLVAFGEKNGVSKQAVQQWLDNSRIPPRVLYEAIRTLDVSPQDMEELLQIAPETKKRWVLTMTLEEQ